MAKKRANGEGNIRKRADGRWEGRYTAGYHPETGKRIIKNVLGKTQAECKAKLSAAMEASFAGCAAHHGNIHSSQILLKSGNTAVLDGIPKILPGSHPKALHLNDLRPVFVQKEDVHIGVEPTFSNEFFQICFRQSHDIHRLRACKVDELAQLPRFTMLVIAEQGRRDLFHPVYGISGRMDTGGLPTAWASGRNDLLSGVAAPIQIFLHMRNDLIALAHLDAATRHQL